MKRGAGIAHSVLACYYQTPRIPAKQAVGWYNVNQARTRLQNHAPGIELMQVFIPWGSIRDGIELSTKVRGRTCAHG